MTKLETVIIENLRPAREMGIGEWAEANIVLSTKQATAFPGRYRMDLTPYVKGIFEAIQDTSVHTVVVEKGAQTGLTTSAYIALLYWICNEPAPALLVYPTEQIARNCSETRVQPMIQDCVAAREQLTDDPDDFTKLQYSLRQCTVNWVGSNSPANLGVRPIRYLIEDEVDKYPLQNDREGDACALAEQRTKTFWNRKILKFSTPTTPDGNINQAYLVGDQRKYYVPCPHCGKMQSLRWAQVKFDSGLPIEQAAAGAYYECEDCKGKIEDRHKYDMVKKGEWRATSKAVTQGYVSFHISSLYSIWTHWKDLVEKFLKTKAYPNQLQDFINSELGEPFYRDAIVISETVLVDRARGYGKGNRFTEGEMKDKYLNVPKIMVMGVDVQKYEMYWCVREFAGRGDSGLVDWGSASSFSQINEIANKYKCEHVGVDSGYRTNEVYQACNAFQFIPTKGTARMGTLVWEQKSINIYEGTRRQDTGETTTLIQFGADHIKDMLYDRLKGVSPFAWWVCKEALADTNYCQQMVSEQCVDRKWEVKRKGLPNHYWDCEVICILMADMYGFNQHIVEE